MCSAITFEMWWRTSIFSSNQFGKCWMCRFIFWNHITEKKNISIGIVNALGNVQSTYFFALPIGTGKMWNTIRPIQITEMERKCHGLNWKLKNKLFNCTIIPIWLSFFFEWKNNHIKIFTFLGIYVWKKSRFNLTEFLWVNNVQPRYQQSLMNHSNFDKEIYCEKTSNTTDLILLI